MLAARVANAMLYSAVLCCAVLCCAVQGVGMMLVSMSTQKAHPDNPCAAVQQMTGKHLYLQPCVNGHSGCAAG